MKVKLKSNTSCQFLLEDKVYTVFAIYIDKKTEFMIDSDSFPSAPYAVDSELVEVVDGRLSKYWVYGIANEDGTQGAGSYNVISFPEWANSKSFFQGLVNGEYQSDIWRSYKEKLELEFAYDIESKAELLNGNWLQCAFCSDAWEATDEDMLNEVLVCPSCQQRQLNPNDR